MTLVSAIKLLDSL